MRCFRRKWRHWFLRIQWCWLMWHRQSWHSTAISCKALHFGKSETFVKESSIRKAAGEMALSQLVQQNLRHHTLFLWSWHFTESQLFLDSISYPGIPPDSIRFANVTSSLQTSNCHLRRPMTPQSTLPVCTPIRISTLVCVISRTALKRGKFSITIWLLGKLRILPLCCAFRPFFKALDKQRLCEKFKKIFGKSQDEIEAPLKSPISFPSACVIR